MPSVSLEIFARRVSEIMPEIAKEFMRRQGSLYELKITLPQLVVLDFLNREGRMRMTDIARFMRVTQAAMTGVVDRLVRDGCASRANDPNDRRIVRVCVTEKGANLVEKINRERRRTIVKIFSRISEKERTDYLNILEHISGQLKFPLPLRGRGKACPPTCPPKPEGRRRKSTQTRHMHWRRRGEGDL